MLTSLLQTAGRVVYRAANPEQGGIFADRLSKEESDKLALYIEQQAAQEPSWYRPARILFGIGCVVVPLAIVCGLVYFLYR